MKILIKLSIFLFITASFSVANKKTTSKVKWYTWEQAVEANKTKKKKLFLDVYTDWCGWCKIMDKNTFENDSIAKFLNANFYPVKLNAEQRDSIIFGGKKFEFVNTEGGRGVHTFAYALLDGKMSYPTVVYLTENYERIMIAPGYKEVPELFKQLNFASLEKYKTQTWEQYNVK
jgi:thioredoxin-related protein